MGRVWRILRFGLLAAAAIAAAIVLVAACAGLALQTAGGRQYLARTIESLASTPGETEIRIGAISPGLPLRLRIDRLEVADRVGPWLTARGLELSWRPWALLSGTLNIGVLALDELDVQREPAAAPATKPEPTGGFSVPRPPVSLRVDRLGIADMRLAEPVVGTPVRLALAGRLAARQAGQIRTELSLDRLDGTPGTVRLDAEYDVGSTVLAIDGAVSEPSGGLIVTLIDAPGHPPLEVGLAGRGPIADWHGTLEAHAAGLIDLSSALSLSAGETTRLAASGKVELPGNPVPALQPALAHGIPFEVAVEQTSEDDLVIDRLALSAEGLAIAAAGRADLGHGTLDAGLDLSIDRSALAADALDPAQFRSARAHVAASGPFAAPAITASGSVDGVAVPSAAAERLTWKAGVAPDEADSEAGTKAAPGLQLSAEGEFLGLRLSPPALAAAVGDAPRFAADGRTDAGFERLAIRSVEVNGHAVRLAGNGVLGLNDGALTADAALSVADFARLAAAIGTRLAGGGEVTAHVTGNVQASAFDGTLDAKLDRLATGVAAADALLGPAPRLDARFAYGEQAGLDVPGFSLAGRNVSAEGAARLPAGFETVDARLGVKIPSLAPLSAPLGSALQGTLDLDATAAGALADPSVTAGLRLRNVSADGFGVARARLDATAASVVSQPNGRLALDAATDAGPVEASADFALGQGQRLQLSPVAARAAGVVLDGDLVAALAPSPLIDGHLRARSEAPAAGIGAGGLRVTGPLGVDIRLTPAAGRQSVAASVQGGPLSIRQRGADAGRIGSLLARADVADALGRPSFRGTVNARDAAFGPADLATAELTGEGTPERMRLDLAVQGAGRNKAHAKTADRLSAGGVLTMPGQAVAFDLDRLQGQLARQPIALDQPARLLLAPERTEVNGLALAIGDGRLAANASLRPGNTAADVRIDGLPVALARAFSTSAPSEGRIDLTALVRTEGRETAGDADLRLRGLGWGADMPAGARFDGEAGGRWAAGRASITGAVHGPEAARLNVSGALPFSLPAGETEPRLDPAGPVDASLTAAADLGKLSRLFGLPDQRVEGVLDGDVRVAGTLSSPQIAGAVTVDKGLYENFVTSTVLEDIAVRVDAPDRRTVNLRLTANDGGSGRLEAEGRARLDEGGSPRIEASLDARDATLIRRDDVTVTTNAQLAYSDTGDAAPRVSGQIEPEVIEVRLLDRLPPSVVILPVREIGRDGDDGGAAKSAGGDPWSAALDLTISMPRRVFVRGRGLDSEWAGALDVTGTTAQPRISGEVNLVRGTFEFAGKRFVLQRGTIGFAGGTQVDPLINAAAEYRASNITAVISVTGLASEPKIEITSQPPLPESEILAQVLFNKSSAKLGPVEAVQLAAAVDSLARGDSASEDAFSFARTFLGLDRLAVAPNSTGGEGSSLAVGRYVGDRVYIGAEQGIESGGNKGTVEVEIAPGISIESEVGQGPSNRTPGTAATQGALGLKWKWDY